MNSTDGWKNPENSVGEECRFIKRRMNRVKVFQAIGPAREAWLRLEPHIFQKINDHKEEIERGVKQSSGYAINLYMTGSRPQTTLPTILVSSANKKERNAVKDIIESLLKELPVNPGIQVKCYAEVPAILAADEELPYTVPRNSPHGITIQGSPTSLCGAQIVSGKSLATLGGAIYLKNGSNVTPFGLTVFHVGTYCEPVEGPSQGDDIEEFAFDESGDESDDENDEILEMASKSSLSLSREPSEESDGRNNDRGLLESPKLLPKSSLKNMRQTTLSSSIGQAENDTGPSSSPHSGLDYQLIPLQDYSPCPVNQFTLKNQSFIQPKFVAREAKEVQIWAATGMTEPVRGRLSLSPYLLKLPSYSLQKLWVVDLERNIMLGDSGSWIVDALSNVYGHIVAAVPGSFRAYILPLHRIFEDIEASTKCKPSLVCESNAHLGEELQPFMWQPSDLSSKGRNPDLDNGNASGTQPVITTSAIKTTLPTKTSLEIPERTQDGQTIHTHIKIGPKIARKEDVVQSVRVIDIESSSSHDSSDSSNETWDCEPAAIPSTSASTSKTKSTSKSASATLGRRFGPSHSVAFESGYSATPHSGQNASVQSPKPPPEPAIPTNSTRPTYTNPQSPWSSPGYSAALPTNNGPGTTHQNPTPWGTAASGPSTIHPHYYDPTAADTAANPFLPSPFSMNYYPPGSAYPLPGSGYILPSSTNPPGAVYPPVSAYPPSGYAYPPSGYAYPPPGSAYPPPGSAYPPPGSAYPPPGSAYPPPDAAFGIPRYAAPAGGYAAPYVYYPQGTSIPTPPNLMGYHIDIQSMLAQAYANGVTAGMQASVLRPQYIPVPQPADYSRSWQVDAEAEKQKRDAREDDTARNDLQDARRDLGVAFKDLIDARREIDELQKELHEFRRPNIYMYEKNRSKRGDDERFGGDNGRSRPPVNIPQRNYEQTGTQQAGEDGPKLEKTSAGDVFGQQANPPETTTTSTLHSRFWRPRSHERITAQEHPPEDPIDIGIFRPRSRAEAENVRIW